MVNPISTLRTLWKTSVSTARKAVMGSIDDLMPPHERFICKFNSGNELNKWHLYSDSEYGGLSSASLEIRDAGDGPCGIFSGNLSIKVSEHSQRNMKRSGFCGMKSRKFGGFVDLDSYSGIAMKLKGDGRRYISTIYTENWVNGSADDEDNSWQAFFLPPPAKWCIHKVPFDMYLPTWKGNVINSNISMNPSRIVGFALSVNAITTTSPTAIAGPGPFGLELDWIKVVR